MTTGIQHRHSERGPECEESSCDIPEPVLVGPQFR